MDVQDRNRAALDAVQERRDEFYEGILELERAMATAAGDDPVAWAQNVAIAVKSMHKVLDDHIAETEAPGSFYDDVIEHVPEPHQGVTAAPGRAPGVRRRTRSARCSKSRASPTTRASSRRGRLPST